MKFRTLVDTVKLYLDSNKHMHEEQYVRIDVFCVNHHAAELLPQDYDNVADVIQATNKVGQYHVSSDIKYPIMGYASS
jgi:Holliday junction resolvase-like predicted endonuclease